MDRDEPKLVKLIKRVLSVKECIILLFSILIFIYNHYASVKLNEDLILSLNKALRQVHLIS